MDRRFGQRVQHRRQLDTVCAGYRRCGGGRYVTITNTGNLTATDGTAINSGSVSINAGGVPAE
jgi:hypothetical protein